VDDADEVAESDESNNVAVFGPFSTGEQYAPLEIGNAWRYAGTQTDEGAPVAFVNEVDVTGQHVVNASVVAMAVRSSNPLNAGRPIVEYLQRDERGVVDWGNDDATDVVTARIAPYRMLLLPLATTYDVLTVPRFGISAGEDFDGDGRVDRMTGYQRLAFVGFEDVDLPVARFTRCAHVRATAVATMRLSYSGRSIRVVGTEHQWLAPGIGPVRIVEELAGVGARRTIEETLTGAATAAGGCGVVEHLTLTSFSASSGVGVTVPPAAASDGAGVLIATVRAPGTGEPHGLIGVVASSTGSPLREFQIADVALDGGNVTTPAVAYGAGRYVVAYRGGGPSLHVRAVTADGAFPWGGDALDLPFATGTERAFRVVFDGTDFLVLVEGYDIPSGDPTVSIARVSADGALLGSRRLSTSFAVGGGVAAAWDGSSALCVWSVDNGLRAVRVASSGEPLDAAPIAFAGGSDFKSHPCVAAAPSGGWFVAWTNSPSGGQSRIKGCRVSADGVVTPPDGVEFASSSYADSSPEAASDGAEFVLVSDSSTPKAIHAARVSLDAVEIPQSAGGLAPTLAAITNGNWFASPIVTQVGDRALVLWWTWSFVSDDRASLVGTLVFPRREDLRNARRAVR
jgi:hypothetical protein